MKKKKSSLSRNRLTAGQKVFDVFNIIFMCLLGIVMFYPMWHVVCASFSSVSAMAEHNGVLLTPLDFNFEAYKMMFKHPLIMKSYGNSIFLVIATVSVQILCTSVCAYVLSRKNVFWNKLFNIIIMITMFFSGGLIPSYLLVSKTLGFNDSYLALILPTAISVYNMIIMRTSFESIPTALEEAAKLDGAGHWGILFRVVLPLSKSIIAVIVLYYAVGAWNAWFDASIYLTSRSKFPLQLILREILIANDTASLANNPAAMDQVSVGESIKYATIVFATVPILCVYPFLQKYFTKGVMIGAVKG